jgi:hypothetical protein
MPDLSSVYADNALDGGATPTTTYFMSLHFAAPGDNGANEISGGTGPYARQPITFGGASSYVQSSTNTQTFTGLPAVGGDLYAGFWDSLSGGNFQIGTPGIAVVGPVAAGASAFFDVGHYTVQAG